MSSIRSGRGGRAVDLQPIARKSSRWIRPPSAIRVPNVDIIFREPEHIEYASTLGLGVADRAKIVQSRRRVMSRIFTLLAIAWLQTTAAPSRVPLLDWPSTTPNAAFKSAGINRVCVPPDRAEAWRAAGFDAIATAESDLAARQALPVPGIESRVDRVSLDTQPVGECQWLAVRAESRGPVRLRAARRKRGPRGR